MRITEHEIARHSIPPAGAGEAPFESVFLRVECDGVCGLSESAVGDTPLEFPEWSDSVEAAIPRFLNLFWSIGNEFQSLEHLTEKLLAFRGQSFAKGALVNACHDACARGKEEPLWQFIGGAKREIALVRNLPVLDSIEKLLSAAGRSLERGAASLAFKLRPGWGLEVVRAMRATFPGVEMRVDFDGSATLDQRDLLLRLQDYDIAAIEQPLDADDLVGHAMLQESLRVPICLDQSVTSLARAEQAIDLGACREIRVAPDKCGGLTTSLQIAAACREAKIECLVGTRACTIVGHRHAAALACTKDVRPELQLEFGRTHGRHDWPPPYNALKSHIAELWDEPGIGIDPQTLASGHVVGLGPTS